MATGETTFTTEGRKVIGGFSTEPFAQGDYPLKLMGNKAEIRCRTEPGSIPYVNVPFAAIGTGGDSGRDRWVYHTLWLNLSIGKNGQVQVDRVDQLTGLATAMGTTAKIPTKTAMAKDKATGELREIQILDGNALVKWLRDNDGVVVQAHIKIEKGTAGYSDKNKIARFIITDNTDAADPFAG